MRVSVCLSRPGDGVLQREVSIDDGERWARPKPKTHCSFVSGKKRAVFGQREELTVTICACVRARTCKVYSHSHTGGCCKTERGMKVKREENWGRGGFGGVIYEIRAGQEQMQYQRQVCAASRGVLQSLEPQSVVFLPLSTFASCHVYVSWIDAHR